jgi:hypothetical protein
MAWPIQPIVLPTAKRVSAPKYINKIREEKKKPQAVKPIDIPGLIRYYRKHSCRISLLSRTALA